MDQAIKVTFRTLKNTIQRHKLIELGDTITEGKPSYTSLLCCLKDTFSNIREASVFWTDHDGDSISINSDSDYALFLRLAATPYKLLYTEEDTPKSSPVNSTALAKPTVEWKIPISEYSPRNLVTNLPAPPQRHPGAQSIAMPKLNARFVKHTTCDDETSIYAPGQKFFKTWRFRNSGTLKWPTLIKLQFVSKLTGDQMSGPETLDVVLGKQIEIDDEIDITVPLIAPNLPGEYTGFWKLSDVDKKKFGNRVRVRITVVEPVAAASITEKERKILQGLSEIGYKESLSTALCLIRKHNLSNQDDTETMLSKLGIRIEV